MEIDEIAAAWSAHTERLERRLAIDERVLERIVVASARRALTVHAIGRWLGVVPLALTLVAVATVLAAHLDQPIYLFGAGTTALYLIGMVVWQVRLAIGAARLDFARPIMAIQADLERQKRASFRALKWALLFGTVVWLPALLSVFEAITGIDALARVDRAWFTANIAFGIAFLVILQWLARRHIDRPDLAPFARRLVDGLSGHGLRTAEQRLRDLTDFARPDTIGS